VKRIDGPTEKRVPTLWGLIRFGLSGA